MRAGLRSFILVLGALLTGAFLVQGSEDLGAAARSISGKAGNSLVWVRVTAKMIQGHMGAMAMGGVPAQNYETVGTVVDPSGLTVVALSAVDPEALFNLALQPRGMSTASGKPLKLEVRTEIVSAALVRPDGTEVPADVVLEEQRLDLAFLRPKETERKFEALDLKARAQPPQLGEGLVVVGRLGKENDYALTVDTGLVRALVPATPPYILCSQNFANYAGSPVFAADGSLLGFLSGRYGTKEPGPRMPFPTMGSPLAQILTVVLRPMAEIQEALGRARQSQEPLKPVTAAPAPPAPETGPKAGLPILPGKAAPPPPDTGAGRKAGEME